MRIRKNKNNKINECIENTIGYYYIEDQIIVVEEII